MNLKHFIGKDQLACMKSACRGEEGEYFRTMIETLKHTLATMPKTYEQEEKGEEAIATLHYFNGGSDWYITERDAGSPDDEDQGVQHQAFGFACLNGDDENAEIGYISIAELIENGVELDLYYKPETIGEIKARIGKNHYEPSDKEDPTELETWFDEGQCPTRDGCMVELDGHCPHGFPSMALEMGLI